MLFVTDFGKHGRWCGNAKGKDLLIAVAFLFGVMVGPGSVMAEAEGGSASEGDEMSGVSGQKKLRVVLIGDSTVCNYPPSRMGQSGWGQMLPKFLDGDAVEVKNWAAGGRSSKSFLIEGRWDKAVALRPDFVLIQFGHNDNTGKGPGKETLTGQVPGELPEEGVGSREIDWYRANLERYIRESREAGAEAIVVTPMERRYVDRRDGSLRTKNRPWAEAASAVAVEMGAVCIDLNAYCHDLFGELGYEGMAALHFTRPNGTIDNTHFGEHGAMVYAKRVAFELREKVAGLGAHVTPRVESDAGQRD